MPNFSNWMGTGEKQKRSAETAMRFCCRAEWCVLLTVRNCANIHVCVWTVSDRRLQVMFLHHKGKSYTPQ